MDTLLEQATPQTPTGRRILRQDYRGNEAYTVSRQDILAVEAEAASAAFFDGLRTGEAGTEKAVNAYEPLVKALRKIAAKMDAWEAECRQAGVWLATDPDARMAAWVRDAAHAALATVTESDSGTSVESSPEREGGE